jgi:hypothetical protein
MAGDPNPMAEFFERIGQKAIRSESSWWYEVQRRVLLSFPYYVLIEPPPEEIEELFGKHKLRAVRYPTPAEAFGFPSAVEVNTDPTYDLSCVQPRTRRYIRQALKTCKYEQIGFDYLMKDGLSLNRDTAERQGRATIYTDPDYWRRYCQAGKAVPGVTAWAVMVEGQLGTYLVAVECDGWWNWLLTNSSATLSSVRTSHVLFYEATRRFFENDPEKKICYGLGSLESVSELDHFKLKVGVTRQPIKQRLVLSTQMRCAASLAREPCLKALGRLFPKSYKIRKAAAMIRRYRQQSREAPSFESQAKE